MRLITFTSNDLIRTWATDVSPFEFAVFLQKLHATERHGIINVIEIDAAQFKQWLANEGIVKLRRNLV